MQWTGGRAGGFTSPGAEPWLPIGDADACNVAAQREDAGSTLHLCRDLIALRREREDLRSGRYAAIGSPDGVWAWRRGETTVVAVNHSDEPAEIPTDADEVVLATRRSREGERLHGRVVLEPWEALVLGQRV